MFSEMLSALVAMS